MLLSIVIPIYNEEDVLSTFHEMLVVEAKKYTSNSYEIIYINDGSKDNTLKIASDIASHNSKVKVINLSRNFGKEIAVTAGIHYATGDATIIMDGDGQHPPMMICEFIEKWKSGARVVIGVRNSNQKEGVVKKFGSIFFYKLFNSLSGTTIVPRSTDFRLIDKSVQKEFIKFTERQRITRGLIDWIGFNREYISFDAPARIAGEASYKTRQLIKLAVDSFTSLSLKPLFAFGWIGLIITLFSMFFGIFIVIEQLILHDPLLLHISGSAILGVLMSFLIGLVLISQSIIAIYISHIHAQAQNRPLFIIDEITSIGINEPNQQ